MKKRLSVLLVLCLLLSVCAAPVALAAGVTVLSTQNLSVDGKTIPCEKYNIDGSNYFKLRDMAYLLNGTGSQFAVGWDAASSTVSITTGQPYTPNGTELKLDGGDKSATSVPSSQTIKIDGVVVSNLSVYNIGGNNYFKLRDLGTALGFEVGYDAATFTATVTTAKEMVWLPVKEVAIDAEGNVSTTKYIYDEKNRILEQVCDATLDWGMAEKISYTYEDNNITYKHTRKYSSGWGPLEDRIFSFDDTGKLLMQERTFYLGEMRYVYHYDAYENVATEIANDLYDPLYGVQVKNYVHTYDAKGNLMKSVCSDGAKDIGTVTYTYDIKGHLIAKIETGEWNGSYAYTYDSDGNMTMERCSGDYTNYVASYTYDADGNMIKCVEVDYDSANTITTTIEYAQFPKAN